MLAFGEATTTLPPPTQLFEATDLNGNPVSASFYLTGGGGLMHFYPQAGTHLPYGWFGYERDWALRQVDRGGYEVRPYGDNPFCYTFLERYTPFPANRGLIPDDCYVLTPALRVEYYFHEPPGWLPAVFGAVAPLTVTTAGGPLVFHDWEVVDPNPGQCRTGNMGVRPIPDDFWIRGAGGATFAEGVEQRLAMQNGDGSVTGKFRAVYAPASPDVSAPLVTVDYPRDCLRLPRNATAHFSFACRDLGSGISTCTAAEGHANGQPIDTSQFGDFSLSVTAIDNAGHSRVRTVRYSVGDLTAPTASPVVITPITPFGWYNHPQITWNWTDNADGVGLDPAQCTHTSVGTVEGEAAVQTATCRDLSGNIGRASITIAVDNTPPGPPSAWDDRVLPNPVVQNQPAQAVSPTWIDDLSGFASVECATVLTDAPGQKTVTCSGTDRAGNTRTRVVPYTVVVPTGEVLFWYEQEVSGTVHRVNADGTGRGSFDVNRARSIGASATNFFYVVRTDVSDGPVVRTNLDGSGGVVIEQGDMFLEVSRSYIYVRNPVNLRKIYHDGADSGEGWLVAGVSPPFAADDQFIYYAPGNQIGRSNVDGSNFVSIATLDATPRDLGERGDFVYWVAGDDGHIGRVKKDGTGLVERLIDVNAQAIAVGATHLFWSNASGGTIGRARLNGTDVQPSFITGAGVNIRNMTIGGAPRLDSIAPTIQLTSPPDGALYTRNQPVSADYTCNDEVDGSGVASCLGTVPSGTPIDTSTLGRKTFAVTARDFSGNERVITSTYIVGYTFGGFAPPVNAAPTVNAGSPGRTYPIKFRLFDNGVPVSDLNAVTSLTYLAASCSSFAGSPSDALEAEATGNTSLRYDAASSSFIYNWKTPQAAGCYTLWLTLRSGQQFRLNFQFK